MTNALYTARVNNRSTTMTTGIEKAITAAGSQENLAAALGLKQQTISAWKTRGHVPLSHVPAVHAISGVPKLELVSKKILAATSQADLF